MDDNEKNQKFLTKLRSVLEDDAITRADFTKAFEEVLKLVVKIEKDLIKRVNDEVNSKVLTGAIALSEMKADVAKMMSDVRKSNDSSFAAIKQRSLDAMNEMFRKMDVQGEMDEMREEHEEMMAECREKMPDKEEMMKDMIDNMMDKMAKHKETPESVRDKLESLPEGEKLSIQAIQDLAKILDEMGQRISSARAGASLVSKRIRFVDDETPSGTVNSSNTVFTITRAPETGSLKVYVNGQRMRVTEDYTLSHKTITFVTAPPTGSIILVDFRY